MFTNLQAIIKRETTSPIEMDLMPPLMQPNSFNEGDRQHTEDSSEQKMNNTTPVSLNNQQSSGAPLQQTSNQKIDTVDTISAGDSNSSLDCHGEGIGNKFKKVVFCKKPTAEERKKTEKERKARQMRRLRKWLTPKNAVVALHELHGPGMSEFTIKTTGQETKAEIIINNIKYEATAPNKTLAKAKVSEQALRDMAIAEMAKAQHTETSTGETAMDCESIEYLADNVPMMHLASFALYKLFSEWQNEGFDVPAIKTPKPKASTSTEIVPNSLAPKIPKTIADLPPDAAQRHPTALLAYMRPQIPYEDRGFLGNDTESKIFVASITVDGTVFEGQGRSKKLARKAAASRACSELFGVVFDAGVLD
ncbi:double-stranded RNA-specific editase 1-like [Anopheles aquasalis]|uniref:double-stranded RNA-specific editase 1-like n=1 Tax=Anopheles aquasalis TaxID=42839 RepID=UPI00215A8C5C|nr:double-stranded RNA-specific editase 1-like [Anopheles aquasalis]XP_050099790.1 double-stranded RNA-specific editase 1-like [Anopheles aquasalis]